MIDILDERKKQIMQKGRETTIECERHSAAGSVSQRACVFCGSRVVLYPVSDALHLIHGPIGCAAYTWDIRGAVSSGPELHRMSFSTDMEENDVIFGGEKKLYTALTELIAEYNPGAAFVYSTCIVGLIGDDVEAICNRVSHETGIKVIPVHSEGFKGTKMDGYRAACIALSKIIGSGNTDGIRKESINILGEFNLAGEAWIIKEYYRKTGVQVVSTMTGDGRIDDISRAHGASLNVVQCSGSMIHLAKMMEEKYGIPFIRVSYFGIEDMSDALYAVGTFFGSTRMHAAASALVRSEVSLLYDELKMYRTKLQGKRAAIYVGGAFKAFSLIKSLKHLGMTVVVAGSQTGNTEDYAYLNELCDDGTVIIDDSNPLELSRFIIEKKADLLVGGVKERPMAFKIGVAFCDHNHERKIPLAGFEGMLNFAREVYTSIMNPVWKFAPRYTDYTGGDYE